MSIFVRNPSQPIERWGMKFDSALEFQVANDMDEIGLGEHWGHHVPSGFPVYYEPDFTIFKQPCMNPQCGVCDEYEWAGDYLKLPRWIEVKPAELLYAVRNAVGLDQRFEGEHRSPLTAEHLDEITTGELGKVKRLAEFAGQSVLVVERMNRHRKLSLLLTPEEVQFSRSHPAVNHQGFLKDCADYVRHLEWAAARERDAAERERLARQHAADRERARSEQVDMAQRWRRTFQLAGSRPALYAGTCVICRRHRTNDYLVVARIDDRHRVMCEEHL